MIERTLTMAAPPPMLELRLDPAPWGALEDDGGAARRVDRQPRRRRDGGAGDRCG
jgi:hypothetical protein